MTLYRLSLWKYIKEKVKEILSISGRCKGDIFLNPAVKAGKDILREGVYEDHIIHALRHFSHQQGYGEIYLDLTAGFGAISSELIPYFQQIILYEPDDHLRDILRVNMSLKDPHGSWKIMSEPTFSAEKMIARCTSGDDLDQLLSSDKAIVMCQADRPIKFSAPHHDVYHYSADMDKSRPLKTLWTLCTKGYAFKMTVIKTSEILGQGDYIFIPKNDSSK